MARPTVHPAGQATFSGRSRWRGTCCRTGTFCPPPSAQGQQDPSRLRQKPIHSAAASPVLYCRYYVRKKHRGRGSEKPPGRSVCVSCRMKLRSTCPLSSEPRGSSPRPAGCWWPPPPPARSSFPDTSGRSRPAPYRSGCRGAPPPCRPDTHSPGSPHSSGGAHPSLRDTAPIPPPGTCQE